MSGGRGLPKSRSHQASVLAFSASNSSWLIAPLPTLIGLPPVSSYPRVPSPSLRHAARHARQRACQSVGVPASPVSSAPDKPTDGRRTTPAAASNLKGSGQRLASLSPRSVCLAPTRTALDGRQLDWRSARLAPYVPSRNLDARRTPELAARAGLGCPHPREPRQFGVIARQT